MLYCGGEYAGLGLFSARFKFWSVCLCTENMPKWYAIEHVPVPAAVVVAVILEIFFGYVPQLSMKLAGPIAEDHDKR